MRKVFLFLYPVKEYFDEYLKNASPRSLQVLNECIEKRYRDKGYEVVFAIHPDRDIFGVEKKDEDDSIDTGISFEDFYYKPGNSYPDPAYMLEQIGRCDKLVIGGFHHRDCVKRVASYCYYEKNVDVLVDLDLTELFFSVYWQKEYFKIDKYSPDRYKKFRKGMKDEKYDALMCPYYGFNKNDRNR